ncbi:MAG: hypothetical protein ABJB12_10375 [Pseudomonadota bacterium]
MNAGCPGGITLSSDQIGTRNTVSGIPAPTVIDTTNGAVNRFYVTPSIPASFALSLSPGEFQASFHVANWSAVAAPDAAWAPVPNGTAVGNGISPAPNKSTIEFACPPNTASTTCGIPTPTQTKQSVYVELKPAPGNTVPITTAAAYVNMEFKCLGCPATGGTAGSGTGGGDMSGAGMNSGGTISGGASSGGTNSGGTGGVTNGGSAPSTGASGAFENAAGEAGSDATSSAGGAVSGAGAASGGKSSSDAGASAVNAGNGGSAGNASSSDKSGCNCAFLAAPSDHGYGAVTLLALSAAIARRRRRPA